MANTFIKATKVVNTALGVLSRDVVLGNLVWRDAGGDFKGAKNDTVTIRVPAFVNARTRTMRSATTITTDDLSETSVDVTLDTHVYKSIGVTDEQMTLDITDFGRQVLQPATSSVVRGIEDSLASEMNAANYAKSFTLDTDDPYIGIIDARVALNRANVPAGGRFLAVGSAVEADLLKSDRLSQFQLAGDNQALREAVIGRIGGFTAVSVPALDPDWAIAAHMTAFVLSMQAPAIPDGVPWGQSATYDGFGLRVLKDYDFVNVRDRLLADVFIGTDVVTDHGVIDGSGKFQPDYGANPILVRAVKLVRGGQS